MPFVSFTPSREVLLSQASLASGRRLGYFLAVVGILSLGWAAYLFCQERIFLARAGRSTARVVQIQASRVRMGLRYSPVFAYEDNAGKEWRIVSGASNDSSAFAVGQTAEVFYPPDDPGQGQLEDFFARWGVSLILGSLGAVLTLVGYVGTGIFEWLQRTSRFP